MVRNLNKPTWRLLGAAGFVLSLLLYQNQPQGFIQQLLLPLLAAICAWLACQNLTAVAFGSGVLAVLAIDFASPDGYHRLVYPALAILCTSYLIQHWIQVFRQRIQDTRQERWRGRRVDPAAEKDQQ